ncbi:MAG: hypothetical protein AAGI68_00915 [Planctomycetota bacterium]
MITPAYRRLSLLMTALCFALAGWSVEYEQLEADGENRVELPECRISIAVPEGWRAAELTGPPVNAIGLAVGDIDTQWRYKLWKPEWVSADGTREAHPEAPGRFYVDIFKFPGKSQPSMNDLAEQIEAVRKAREPLRNGWRIEGPDREQIGAFHRVTYYSVSQPEHWYLTHGRPMIIAMTFIGRDAEAPDGRHQAVFDACLVYIYDSRKEEDLFRKLIDTVRLMPDSDAP